MDALALLTADHNRVRGLFARFEEAKEDPAQAAPLGAEIVQELEVHTRIEEEHFYPWARDLSDEIREVIDEGVEEHHVVKVLIGELQQLDPADAAWTAKMTVLIENVEHHAEEEEQELFTAVRRAADADDLVALAEELEQAKAELGAPVTADKMGLTKGELEALARSQQIPGRSSMDHDELAATVAPPTP